MKLYEVENEILILEDKLDLHLRETQGDLDEFEFAEEYEKLKGERDQKILNLGSWYKSLSAESVSFATEIKTLQHKKKVIDNKMKWIKDFINSYLKVGEKINDTRVQLSWHKSEALEVDESKFDIKELASEWIVTTKAIDKTKIKSALKIGKHFEGITLKQNNNLQIK